MDICAQISAEDSRTLTCGSILTTSIELTPLGEFPISFHLKSITRESWDYPHFLRAHRAGQAICPENPARLRRKFSYSRNEYPAF
jgi:hypothetical protein